ncbi:MAG: MBL fold metallo-hydrolase [Rhodothermales bacterium]
MKLCLQSVFLLHTLFILSTPVVAQEDQNNRVIESRQINDNFYVFFGGNGLGANVGMSVGKDGVLLIDTMNESSGPMLLEAIRKITDKPIKYVLNTHSDADHSGGNSLFAAHGAVILAQENARYSRAVGELYFKDELTLIFNEEEFVASHVIAHSYNDAVIYLPANNLVFMGDTFTTSWHPTFSTGGIEGQYKALDIALELADEDTQIVPGHGELANREVLAEFRRDSGLWVHQIAELETQDMSLDALAADESLRDIVNRFNRVNRPDFVPQNRLRRFIERTLSSDFVLKYPLPTHRLLAYEGWYSMEDGSMIEVKLMSESLYLLDKGNYMVQLIPVSETRFHMRGRLDDFLVFGIEEDGDAAGLSLMIDNDLVTGNRVLR